MELELAYRPTGKQLAFHASTADEVLYGGAAGGGKSYAICWDALMRCLKYPQTHAYLFRRTYPELEMTLVRTMMRIAPKELGKYVASAHELRLSNGSVIHFCHLSNEGDGLLKYQGAEIHWLYFDELTHFTKPMYDYLRTTTARGKAAGHYALRAMRKQPRRSGARMGEGAIRGQRRARGSAIAEADGGKQHTRRGEREADRIHPGDGDGQSAHHAGLHRGAGAEAQGAAGCAAPGQSGTHSTGRLSRSLWTIRRTTRTGCTRTSSNRSKFHGTGRGWSVSTTDTRGLFLWRLGGGRGGTGLPIQGALRLRAGEANVGVTCPPGEIARQLADLMEPEFEEGIHVSGIADPAIWDRSRG